MEGPMDGRLAEDKAGEVEKQDIALEDFTYPEEKLRFHFVVYGELLRILRRILPMFQQDELSRLPGWERNESGGSRTNLEPTTTVQEGAKDGLDFRCGGEDGKERTDAREGQKAKSRRLAE